MNFDAVFSHVWNNMYGILGLFVSVGGLAYPMLKKWIDLKKAIKEKENANLKSNLAICSTSSRSIFFLQQIIKAAMETVLWAIWGVTWLLLSFITLPYLRDSYMAIFVSLTAFLNMVISRREFSGTVRSYFRLYFETNPNDVVYPAQGAEDMKPVIDQK